MSAPGERVDAASDARTVNNIVRHQYRVLTDAEKEHMLRVKDLGLVFIEQLHKIGGTHERMLIDGEDARQASRELALAQTKIEEAVMWATKHITK